VPRGRDSLPFRTAACRNSWISNIASLVGRQLNNTFYKSVNKRLLIPLLVLAAVLAESYFVRKSVAAADTDKSTLPVTSGKPTPLLNAQPVGVSSSPVVPTSDWTLKWSPDARDPRTQGLNAFEGVEDDRRNSHPEVKHIYTTGANYRFDMHTVDRDGPDRQRNEVKGMQSVNDRDLIIKKGETWRFTYSMFIPSTLNATAGFTHIMQQKMVTDAGSSGGPVVTLSLHIHDKTPSLELRLQTSDEGFDPEHFNPVPLAPLQNKWINVEFEFKFDSGTSGYARMVVKDGSKVISDKTRTGIDLFRENEGANPRVRPKWGIYRSLNSSNLQDTYLLITDMKAYQKE